MAVARWFSCLTLIAILAAGGSIASSVEGSAENLAEDSGEDRAFVVTTFERVFVSGGATIELLQGDEFVMTALGSLDVLNDLTVESGDGSLFIDTGDHGAADLVIRLTFVNLREVVCDGQVVITSNSLRVGHLVIEGNGTSSIELRDLVADELQITGLGATKFTLSGQVERQVINIDGSGAYRAEDLFVIRTVRMSHVTPFVATATRLPKGPLLHFSSFPAAKIWGQVQARELRVQVLLQRARRSMISRGACP